MLANPKTHDVEFLDFYFLFEAVPAISKLSVS